MKKTSPNISIRCRYFEITKTHVSILINGSHAFISLIILAH